MVQRCRENAYKQGESRKGEGGKETDRCPLTHCTDFLVVMLISQLKQPNYQLTNLWKISQMRVMEKFERSCVIHPDTEGVSVLELQKQLRRMRGHFHLELHTVTVSHGMYRPIVQLPYPCY
jgi:hypothetical protein